VPEQDSVYDGLADGVVIADAAGIVQVFNRAAERVTGLAAAAVVGRPLVDALPLSDGAGRDWWLVSNPFGGLRTRTRQVERALQLPDGRTVLVTAHYERGGRGGVVDRVVLGLRGTEARDRMEQVHADLIATVAHELRSPLTGIKGFTATLLHRWDLFSDEQRKFMLEAVDADADRLTRLIAELLDVARIDSGRVQLKRLPTDLAALIRHRVDAQVAAGRPAADYVLDLVADAPEVWVDPDKIGQVLDNLLENAVKHGEPPVTVSLGHDPDGVVLAVSDEGPGVPEHQAHRVFGRFWKGPDRSSSTGLGLYVVRGLVEAHGGRVALVPAPTGGARFVVVLPLGDPTATPAADAAAEAVEGERGAASEESAATG
jgi:PAS domain S-box-containing protein